MLALSGRVRAAFAAVAAVLLSGCANSPLLVSHSSNPDTVASGSVHGGQQPVAGAAIQLYAVGTTGDGSAATPLLSTPAMTDANGNFNITGAYSCGSATLVYITATGGNPGLGGGASNSDLAMMTALGPCSSLSASTYVSINELTTVAAVSGLYPYMNSLSRVGSATSDKAALATAFNAASQLVDPGSGTAPGSSLPVNSGVPLAQLNSLGDILSACINSSGGVANDGSACGTLFGLTTAGGTAPADTIAAMLNIARYPTLNTASLYALITPAAPFQPVLSAAPASFATAVTTANLLSGTTGLSFGSVPVGTPASSQTAILANPATAALAAGTYTLAGVNPGDFMQTNTCTSTFMPGATCSLSVTFTPQGAGPRSAVLLIYANGQASQVPLSGTGVATGTGPVVLSMQNPLYFYNEYQAVTVTNYGTTAVGIGSVSIPLPLTALSNCGPILLAQSVCTIYVGSQGITYSSQGTGPGGTVLTVGITGTTSQTISTSPFASRLIFYSNLFYGQPVGTTKTSSQYPYASSPGTFYGSAATDFSVGACNTSNSMCTFYFTPSAVGSRRAYYTLSVNTTGAGAYGIGLGMAPSFEFAPIAVNLGTFPVGGGGAVSTPVISTSTSPITFNTPTITTYLGTATDFALTNSDTYCSTLQGSTASATTYNSCSAGIHYTPQSAGLKNISLNLSDTTGHSATVSLFYTAVYAAPILSRTAINFGTVQAGTSSAPMTVSATLTNRDPMSAQISPSGAPFAVSGSPYCAAGPACSFAVTFNPAAAGTQTGTLLITDLISGLTASTALSGLGQASGSFSITPSTLTYSTRPVGSTSLAQTITISNTGNVAVSLQSIAITGANAADFTQTNNCPASVPVGESCTVNVSFTPQSTGVRSATVVIQSTAGSSPNQVSVSGYGS